MTKRNSRQKQQLPALWIGAALAILGVVLVGAYLLFGSSNTSSDEAESVSFPDIHGMSFTGDGEQLRVATHHGLVSYQDGEWSKPDLPENDYMGYSGTEDGFYSSGHPGEGSDLPNPIGLVNSQDLGASLRTINFAGETDFHTMAASYYEDAVYVVNPAPNSLLTAGLHYSIDGGETWTQSTANGLTSSPIQIAVHPTDTNIIAIGTEQGLFLSQDYGENFEAIDTNSIVSTVAFDPSGDRLLFAFGRVASYDLSSGEVTGLESSPEVATDQAIVYIAASPNSDDLAIATSNRDIFYSPDNGQTWQQIGDNGTSL